LPISPNLVWRVRLLAVREDHLVTEMPTTMGHALPLEAGAALVGVMSIGQNRWMFHTRVLDVQARPGAAGRGELVLRLAMPEKVERCQRRQHDRVSTIELRLPKVACWPLLDLASAVVAEKATEMQL